MEIVERSWAVVRPLDRQELVRYSRTSWWFLADAMPSVLLSSIVLALGIVILSDPVDKCGTSSSYTVLLLAKLYLVSFICLAPASIGLRFLVLNCGFTLPLFAFLDNVSFFC